MRKLIIILSLLWFSCNEEKKQAFFNLNVEVHPENSGRVEFPSGPIESGKQVVIKALPADGYLFSGWSGSTNGTENPLTIVMKENQNIIASFEKKNYQLKVLTDGKGIVNEEIVNNARLTGEYPHGTEVKLTAVPDKGWYFVGWEGDLSGDENPKKLIVDSPREVKAIFKEDVPVGLSIANGKTNLFVSETHKIDLIAHYKSGKEIVLDKSEWTIINWSGKGSIAVENEYVRGVRSGEVEVVFFHNGFRKNIHLFVSAIEEVTDFNESLKTPAQGSSLEVPVVVINYLPTNDGLKLDMNRAPDNYFDLLYSTLDEAKARIEGELRITKLGIEEGTRYRQHSKSEPVNPYVGIKVVKYFNVYELNLKPWLHNGGMKTLDYYTLFSKLNMEDLVNNMGVKEVWITVFNKDKFPSVEKSPFNNPDTYYGLPESNMSSPYTGDISNSHRDADDLPVYKNTYVVYGNSGHRGADTNLHNRGHQIEAQMHYLDLTQSQEGNWLFWNHFVGVPKGGTWIPYGRVGMTHFPPNTRVDYDYDNSTLVRSDIQNWRPEGGDFAEVNSQLWKSRRYSFDMTNSFTLNGIPFTNRYSNDPQVLWLLYWWQTVPGVGHDLKFEGRPLSNWWDIFYKWDDTIKSMGGLVNSPSARGRINVSSEGVNSPVCTHTNLPR